MQPSWSIPFRFNNVQANCQGAPRKQPQRVIGLLERGCPTNSWLLQWGLLQHSCVLHDTGIAQHCLVLVPTWLGSSKPVVRHTVEQATASLVCSSSEGCADEQDQDNQNSCQRSQEHAFRQLIYHSELRKVWQEGGSRVSHCSCSPTE